MHNLNLRNQTHLTSYDHLFGCGHVEQLCLVEAHVIYTTAPTTSPVFMVQAVNKDI